MMQARGILPDLITFTTLISGYCRKGDMEKAQLIFHAMQQGGVLPDTRTFVHLIKGYCKKGDMEKEESGDVLPELPQVAATRMSSHETLRRNTKRLTM